MVANTSPIFPVAPKEGHVSIANADGQNLKTVYTAGANGSRISRLTLNSTDTANRDVGIFVNGSLVATVQVAIGAGQSSGVPAKDVFADANFKQAYFDANGNLVMDIPAGVILAINAPATVTATKTITGNMLAADF